MDYEFLVPAGIGGGTSRDFGVRSRMWKIDVGHLWLENGGVFALPTIRLRQGRRVSFI